MYHCIGDGHHLPMAHVYAFVETHWDEAHASTFVFPKVGYKHFWYCRENRCGGGVSVFVHESLAHKLITSLPKPEVLLLSLGNSELLLAVVYHPPPPSCPSTQEASEWLASLQQALLQAPPHKHMLLLGHGHSLQLPSILLEEGINVQDTSHPALLALNMPFTQTEVVQAIYQLRNGRASADGFQAELLRWARDPNAELPNAAASWVKGDLTTILNAVFQGEAGVPKSWLKAYVTPVFKGKGDPTHATSYRPITVSGLLYKLFSSILLTRLQLALEQLGVRAPTQLGFRKGKGTEQAVWLLHHCITRACSPVAKGGLGGKLYTCFIDLKQAFDSVDRDILWTRLQELGVPQGPFLKAVKSLYSTTEFSVRVNGRCGEDPLRTTRGVKQGCPISPFLFGLLMDKLYHRLQTDCPSLGVTLLSQLGTIINHIMYADDVVLFATSPVELQRLVDTLQVFCAEVGLTVNADKSVVMVFDSEGRRAPQSTPLVIKIGGQHILQQVSSFKYLGVTFHNTGWVNIAGQAKALDATRAVGALWRGAQAHKVNCRDTILRLYKAQVLPIATYGAGIWGMHHLSLSHADAVLSSSSQDMQNLFLRLISGAHPNISKWVLHRNASLPPIQLEIYKAMARVWSSLKKDSAILREALTSDIALFRQGCCCWSGQLIQHLLQLGCFPDLEGPPAIAKRQLFSLTVDDLFSRPFAVASVEKRANAFYDQLWQKEVEGTVLRDHDDMSTCSATRLQKYILNDKTHHLKYHGPGYLVDTLFRFRVGAAGLKAGIHTSHLGDRFCPACGHPEVEDEHHFLNVCGAYSHIRRSPLFQPLFTIMEQHGILAFMNTDNQHLLARCLANMLRFRRDTIATRAQLGP